MSQFHNFKTPHGSVYFNVAQMHGCCGTTVIYDVGFRNVSDADKLYQYFHDEIIFGGEDLSEAKQDGRFVSAINRDNDKWLVNKFILTDAKRSKTANSIYNFCHSVGAHYGTVTHNPNSGNKVQVFELSRPKDKYLSKHGRYVSQETGVQTP